MKATTTRLNDPLLAFIACSLPLGAFAQSVTPGELNEAARKGEQLLREQQQLERERQMEQDRERQKPAGAALPEAPPAEITRDREEKCIEVKRLEVVGARLLPSKKMAALEADIAGHCVGIGAINDLLRRITSEYVSLGYVTTRAYVPPQETQDGRLTIVVIEGTVERIDVEPAGSVRVNTAFPNVAGSVLNLRQIEQGIDQLNRLASNNAKLDIRPGSTPGSSVLVILNDRQRRLTGSLATDNTGSPETGELQGTATFSTDDPFGLNDSLLLTYQHSLDDPAGPAMSRATSLSYSIPYGWWTASLQLSDSKYASVVQGITRSFLTEGDSRTATLRFERVAYRDRSRKLTLYGSMTRRDSENLVAGERIDSSSRVLSLLELQANLSIVDGGSLWSFDAGFTRGVPWWGGLNDHEKMPSGAPCAQFEKVNVGAGLTRSLGFFGLRPQLTSTLAAQWSNDVLYPSEQIAVTGLFSVRGYRDVRLFGDRGVTWRNELALPLSMNGWGNRPIAVRPFIGLDAGRIWSREQVPGAYATGWAGGVNLSRASANLQLSWSGAGPRSDSLASDHLLFARIAASF